MGTTYCPCCPSCCCDCNCDCNCRCEAWKDGCMDSDSTCMAAWLEWLKEDVKDGET